MTTQTFLTADCPGCGTQIAPTLLACPACGRLVYSDRLGGLSQAAKEATSRGDAPAALSAWREVLDLLPLGSRQHAAVSAQITELGRAGGNLASSSHTPERAAARAKSPVSALAAGIGAIALTLWKFKALLLGLTKASTLLTMLLSFGVYWTYFGWKFALGLVLSIYVHEMGHVFALRRYGFRATAPMFIPGFGALIRLQQQVVNPYEDAVIGLAGPIYGLGAAVATLGLWYATRQPIFAAIAGVNAWINLFNLLPISPLDGGRGFHAMSRLQKFLAAATAAAAWHYTNDGLLMLLAIVCAVRAFGAETNKEGIWKTTITYAALVIALTFVSLVRLQTHIR